MTDHSECSVTRYSEYITNDFEWNICIMNVIDGSHPFLSCHSCNFILMAGLVAIAAANSTNPPLPSPRNVAALAPCSFSHLATSLLS